MPAGQVGSAEWKMPRILLVEDNEMNRDMLSRRLMRRGYEVLIAIDGQQGIDMAMVKRPDPVIDGREVTRRLRAEETASRIPVISSSFGRPEPTGRPSSSARFFSLLRRRSGDPIRHR